ncbi:MAG: YCF48-related protein [Bacteroidales bacterium]|nr:YCF48-related protein [Bacteroidales bacterium]
MNIFRTRHFLLLLLHIVAIPLLQAQTDAWERINPRPVESSLNDISLLPDNRIVAVGSNATVVYSDNFGADWEIIYTPDNISRGVGFTRVDFADELHGMAVGTYFSIIRTDDGGVTWSDISPGAQYYYYDYKDVCFRNPSNCYITGDENNSFLLHSSDGGESWDTAFQTTGGMFNQVQFVDENTGFLSGGEGNYFFKSTNGGENWGLIEVDPGIEELRVGTIYFTGKDTGFIDGAVGGTNWYSILLKTIDGGLSWHEVITDYWGASKFFFINQDTGLTICGSPWYSNFVSKTTDGGESWELISDDMGTWSFQGLCMNTEGDGLIVGSYGQIYRSEDFGSSWEAVYTNACLGFSITKTFITGDSTILANIYTSLGVPNNHAMKSLDRGATWSVAPEYPDGISSISFVNDSVAFYVDGTEGIYKSTDNGNSWNFYDLEVSEFQTLSIDFVNDQTGFAAGSGEGYGITMYRTQDQGETWIEVFSNVFITVDNMLPYEIEFKDDSVGFIVGEIGNGNECNIIVTYDRGNTWEIDTLPYTHSFDGIQFLNPDTGFLYGYGNVLKTINGGQDWFHVTVNTEDALNVKNMSFPTSQTGYAINGSSSLLSILKTVDGGDTWNCLSAPTSSTLNVINFFTEEEGLIFGNNGLIFRTQTGGMVNVAEPPINSTQESGWKCSPNPFSNNINIISSLDISHDILIRIFDFTGRPIKYYSGSSAIADETFFIWDGKDDHGNKVSSGIYIICINHNSSQETLKILKF